jgi:hypothetical protein
VGRRAAQILLALAIVAIMQRRRGLQLAMALRDNDTALIYSRRSRSFGAFGFSAPGRWQSWPPPLTNRSSRRH